MLRLLDRDGHGQRLRDLLSRFHAQELSLGAVLEELEAEVERVHREASMRRLIDEGDDRALLARCAKLQTECDLLATELVHVRMAIAGALEELTDHDQRRFDAADALLSTPA